MIELVTPAARYQASYLAALDEFGGAHRDGDGVLVEEADETFPGWSIDRAELGTAPGFQRLVDWRADAATPEHPRRDGHRPGPGDLRRGQRWLSPGHRGQRRGL